MSVLDYSKWDHIEVSDDEDDTHPNIDTPSLFRWRHQARIERDNAWKKEKAEFESQYNAFLRKFSECEANVNEARNSGSLNLKELESELEKLKKEEEEWNVKVADFKKKERMRPWNIDTISKEGKSRTVINSARLKHEEPETEDSEDAAIDRLKEFVKKNEKKIKQFGMLQKPMDSQNYLVENPNLVCEHTANHLVLWCIDLAVEEKFDLMNHVSHQCIVMQFILELAKSLKCDPRACIRPFFAKFVNPEPEYHRAFTDELEAFRDRIRARAKARIEEAMAQVEEEERQKRLGPGGLDPVEVFESLPPALQECFEKKDVELLKNVLCGMKPEDAEYHMKRCVDSGLWVDNASGESNTENDGDFKADPESSSPSEPDPVA